MENRTGLYSLRGVKIYVFILTIVSLSLFVSLIHSQPAKAEGFLSQTVRCVVGGLLGADCRTPSPAPTPTHTPTPVFTPSPTAPAPAASSQAPSQSQSQPVSSSSTGGSTGNAPVASSSNQTQSASIRQTTGSQLKRVAPLNVDLPESPQLPTLPVTNHRTTSEANILSFVFPYGAGFGQADTAAATPVAIEASKEGWKVLGIAWYWWGIGALAIFGVAYLYRKHIVYKTHTL